MTGSVPPELIQSILTYGMFGIVGVAGGWVLSRWWKKKATEAKIKKDLANQKKPETEEPK